MIHRSLDPGILVGMVILWFPLTSPAAGKICSNPDAEESSRETPGSHRVVRGETVWGIASRYDTSVGELMELNHLESERLKEGRLLKIPSHDRSNYASTEGQSRRYVVKEDESLRSIVRKLHVTSEELQDANPRLNVHKLSAGVKLNVPSHADRSDSSDRYEAPPTYVRSKKHEEGGSRYTIQGDETFSSIARRYHVHVEDIMAANPDVRPERLHEGLVIRIPVKGDTTDTPPYRSRVTDSDSSDDSTPSKKSKHKNYEATPGSGYADADRDSGQVRRGYKDDNAEHSYIARSGDSLEGIAKRFGVSVRRLVNANTDLTPDTHIRAGDEITIPRRYTSTTASR